MKPPPIEIMGRRIGRPEMSTRELKTTNTAVRLKLAQSLSDPPEGDDLRLLLAQAGGTMSKLANLLEAPMHASCGLNTGLKCADCSIDDEPCPNCYQTWWVTRHPNVVVS